MNGNALTKQCVWPKNLQLLQAGEVQKIKKKNFLKSLEKILKRDP